MTLVEWAHTHIDQVFFHHHYSICSNYATTINDDDNDQHIIYGNQNKDFYQNKK